VSVQVGFSYVPILWDRRPSGNSALSRQLFLHLSVDNWKADLMAVSPDGGFFTFRMLPPGRVWYFFSDGHNRVLLRNDRPVAKHPRLGFERNYLDLPR
jgi:hypothetical protein